METCRRFSPEGPPQSASIESVEELPPEELSVERMRASGPGGQHGQKTESRVRVRWHFRESSLLSDEQKKILEQLFPEGYIEKICQEGRLQQRNLRMAEMEILRLAREALKPKKERIPTAPTERSEMERMKHKRRISEKKRSRQKVTDY